MQEKTKKLLKQRNENLAHIIVIEEINDKLTRDMCEIEGSCTHCKNWHYPHCGELITL